MVSTPSERDVIYRRRPPPEIHGAVVRRRMFFSPSLPDRIWDPTWPRVEWVPEVKWDGRNADRLPHANATVKSGLHCTSARMDCGAVCCRFMPYTESLLYMPIIVRHFPPRGWAARRSCRRVSWATGQAQKCGQRVASSSSFPGRVFLALILVSDTEL